MKVKGGPIQPTIDSYKEFLYRFQPRYGLTGSGIQYSPTGAAGTTAAEILSVLVNPGYQMSPKWMEAALTSKFTLTASTGGTTIYYWQARQIITDPIGTLRQTTWSMITSGTRVITIGSAAGNNQENTDSGYIPSPPALPAEFRLMAEGNVSGVVVGEIKNNSYIKAIGNIIPGV